MILKTQIDTSSDQYQTNYKHHSNLVEALNKNLKSAQNLGSTKAKKKFAEKNKLLPYERIQTLLDSQSPFIELSSFAGFDEESPESSQLATCITGIGVVSGKTCMILCSNPLIKGGAINVVSTQKYLRAQEISVSLNLPCIHLTESAGADLRYMADVFLPGGQIFKNITRASAKGIPQIGLVFGSSTAGGAYIPALCDHLVMVKNQAKVYLAGPPLVKLATGEISSHEELGGADLHNSVSGVADYLANDDKDAIRIGRDIMATLNIKSSHEFTPAKPPAYNPDELLGILPSDPKHQLDMYEVLARIIDDSGYNWMLLKF